MIKISKLGLAVCLVWVSLGSTQTALASSTSVLVSDLGNGLSVTTFSDPDGSVTKVASGITRDNLSRASKDLVSELGLPPRPATDAEFQIWLNDYSGSNSEAPTAQLSTSEDSKFTSIDNYNWGGYGAGTKDIVNTAYVAIKANFVVPQISPSCTNYPSYKVGAWVGLGGRNGSSNDLVQQGIGWCSIDKTVNKFTPWTEFAATESPRAFCNATNWQVNAGDVIYNNMSFQNSTNTAYFYMQDQTSGVKHSCSMTPPTGWSFNGNVGECIAEVPGQGNGALWLLSRYGTIPFTNCQIELGSNSTWYPIGSRSTSTQFNNISLIDNAPMQDTGALGGDNMSFTMTYLRSN